jgi:hypothetical protein
MNITLTMKEMWKKYVFKVFYLLYKNIQHKGSEWEQDKSPLTKKTP